MTHPPAAGDTSQGFDPASFTRPTPTLRTYYIICCAFSGPFFPLFFIPAWLKYHTLRYAFDERGVSMAWGMFFRREVHLTYRRIQDIQLTRGIIQRWLGLATLKVQTASATAGAEMTILGAPEPEKVRDYLYARMRGARGLDDDSAGADAGADSAAAPADEALALLRDIRDELRSRREGAGAAP